MKRKRKVPMIKEYEEIYHDWLKEMPLLKSGMPVARVVLELQKALRRVMQGTQNNPPPANTGEGKV